MAAMNTDPSIPVVDSPNPAHTATADSVDGMNIFWILFALSVASSIHALGSAPGFPAEFTRYFRILPLSSAFDTLILYRDFFQHWSPLQRWRHYQPGDFSPFGRLMSSFSMLFSSARISARQIAIRRFAHAHAHKDKDNLELLDLPTSTAGSQDEGDEVQAERLKLRLTMSIPSLLDFWPRFFANAGVIFVYTKICGFNNVAYSIAIATIYFISWLGMEVLLYLAFGLSPNMATVHRQELKDVLAEHPRHAGGDTARRDKILRAFGVFLNIGQLIALVVVFILAAVSWAKDGSEGQPPAQGEGTDENALWTFVKAWYSTAINLPYFPVFSDLLGWKWGLFMDSWRAVLQVGGDNMLLYILAVFFAGLLTAILIYPFLIASFLIIYTPTFLCVCLFIAPVFLLFHLGYCCHNVYLSLPAWWANTEVWAAKVRVERWHLVLRVAAGGVMAGALTFFNVFFDSRQTGKEDWTGKLD